MVVGGTDVLDDLVLQLRKTIVAWWEWACGAPEATHVSTNDPRYKIVTEHRGRDYLAHPPASSCGDLPHFGLEKIGVRLPWVNREATLGSRWRGSWLNINQLVYPPIGACPEAKEWTPDVDVQGGDVVVVANRWPSGKDAHAVCVLHTEVDPHPEWSTAEYGNEHGNPRDVGGLRYRILRSGHILGSRRIRVWLSLDRVVRSAYRQGLLSAAEVLPSAVYPSEAPTWPG
jgi:hypothetical protein